MTTTYDGDVLDLASARAGIALGSAAELVEHVLMHRIPATTHGPATTPVAGPSHVQEDA